MPCERVGEFQIEPDVVFIKMTDRSGWIVRYLKYLIIYRAACKVKNLNFTLSIHRIVAFDGSQNTQCHPEKGFLTCSL
jgi:hypothetical protein